MKTIERYIIGQIIQMILLVSLVLLGIELFILWINEYSHIGKGNYQLLAATQFIFLRMPSEFYDLFPIVGLLACLLSLSQLANQSELVVLRAARFSLNNMIKTLLICAVIVNVFILVLGEVIAPYALHLAYNKKALEASHGQALRNRDGLWFKENERFIHINKVHDPKHIEGIEQMDFEQGQLRLLRQAAHGEYTNGWQLSDVKETQFSKNLTQHHVSKLNWDVSLKPEFLRHASVNNRELNLLDLYAKHDQSSTYEFWSRLFKPLLITIMMLLAIPFVFAAQYKSSLGARLLIGLSFGFLYYCFERVLGPLCVLYQLPPYWVALVPLFVFGLIGIVVRRQIA